jgi:type IV pilus assembly protein PilE
VTLKDRRITQFTLSETLTVVAVLAVIVAIAIPMWRTHQLRERRHDAMDALRAVQTAQDEYFGKHARYADETQLRASVPKALPDGAAAERARYHITVSKSADDLTYTAVARAVPREGETVDTRCVELRIDQNGRRIAVDAEGVDRSADCWR